MKAYVINLDRSPERLAWFLRQVEGMRLDLVRVAAIDAQTLDRSASGKMHGLGSIENPLADAEIACLLSHRKTWQIVADGSDDWAFVAEDDIHLAPGADRFLSSADWIPTGALLIKAETNLRRQELSFELVGRAFGHELRQLRSDHYGSAGYFVSRTAALRLLDFTEGRCEPIDVLLFSPELGIMREMPVLQLTPALCIQDMFVAEHRHSGVLASQIAAPRLERRASEKRSPGHTVSYKIARELRRLAIDLGTTLRLVWRRAGRRSVFRKVPIDLPGRGLLATPRTSGAPGRQAPRL